MNIDLIVQHVQEHLAIYGVGALVALAVIVVFRTYTFPFLYHTGEYLAYCAAVHLVLAGVIRAFSWFRSETTFKNYDGGLSKDFEAYTTPVALNVWKQELYNPEWLFWVEIALAIVLLYVVVFIRPTQFNRYSNRRQRQAARKRSQRDKQRGQQQPGSAAHTPGFSRLR